MVGILVGLFGGLALFIFALQSMSESLQKLAGKRAHQVLGALTSIPVVGVLVGTLLAIIVQGSTLVTVMVVGFVNASMMNLKQAIAVIMGANIGTTLTAHLMALRITDFWPFLAAIGFIVYFFFKRKKIKTAGFAIFSLGILLLGMALMSQAMAPLRQNEAFQMLILTLSDNRILGFLVGAVFTAIIQSSTAATVVIVGMATQGLIPLEAALPLVLGANVGTTITAILASIGTTVSARRAAMAHLMFNVFGAIIFLALLSQFETLVLAISPVGDVPQQIANAHTLFSVISTIIFLPLITPFSKLIMKMVPGQEISMERGTIFLDWNMVTSPSVAVPLAQKELLRMADLAGQNVELAVEGFLERDEKKLKLMREQEEIVDELEKEISRYLAKVSQSGMDDAMSVRHTELLLATNDLERISDHAENITELAKVMMDDNISFSETALIELKEMYELVQETLRTAVQSVRDENPSLGERVKELEDQVDEKEEALRMSHIKRLGEGLCSAESGVIFLDIISNFERIGDHANNISDIPKGKL